MSQVRLRLVPRAYSAGDRRVRGPWLAGVAGVRRARVPRVDGTWTAPADKRTARGGEARPGHKEGNVRRLGAAICFKGKQKQTQGGESCRLLPPV